MGSYYMAIDIGVSKGCHILGHMEEGKLKTEEIYRFENGAVEVEGELCWDLRRLFEEIKIGLIKCREQGKLPIFVGIDTWGYDFVLLDEQDQVIGNAVSHRDTDAEGVSKLTAIKEKHHDYLEKAETMLMLPDYFNFMLTGVRWAEYTNCVTTHLINSVTNVWDDELIERLGFPRAIFPEMKRPGTVIGNLTREVTEELGYDCIVVLPATNNIASAELAVPLSRGKHNAENLLLVGEQGPAQAAAIGNILVQMFISRELNDLKAARECVEKSFHLQENKEEQD